MPADVVRVGVARSEVVAEHVVDELVAVVVKVVAGDLAGIAPHVVVQVGVVVIHARVDHPDDRARVAGGHVPGLLRVDVGVVSALGYPCQIDLPGVVQPVLKVAPGVGGNCLEAGHDDVGLDT